MSERDGTYAEVDRERKVQAGARRYLVRRHHDLRQVFLVFVAWLFRPPGFFHSLWFCFWYKQWPNDADYD